MLSKAKAMYRTATQGKGGVAPGDARHRAAQGTVERGTGRRKTWLRFSLAM